MEFAAQTAQTMKRYSIEEYFEIERQSEIKHEYHDGVIVALMGGEAHRYGEAVSMAGGSSSHATIIFNTSGEIHQHLRGKPCRGYSSDLRIGVPPTPFFYYPDLSVICGSLQYDPRPANSSLVINPTLILEVLSPTTELYDRTDKFDEYLKLESLREYVLISQDRPRIETRFRQGDGSWVLSNSVGIDAIATLRSLAIPLVLREIYAGVVFPPSQTVHSDMPPGNVPTP